MIERDFLHFLFECLNKPIRTSRIMEVPNQKSKSDSVKSSSVLEKSLSPEWEADRLLQLSQQNYSKTERSVLLLLRKVWVGERSRCWSLPRLYRKIICGLGLVYGRRPTLSTNFVLARKIEKILLFAWTSQRNLVFHCPWVGNRTISTNTADWRSLL